MAKNPGRGRNVARRNNVPNVVGQTSSTAQSNLTAAGFDAFITGTQNTGDQNLNDKIASQSIPAGEVRELGADVNLVKYTFSFTPFGFAPFGFTPFGFTPFGFTPFGFTPVFNFAPPLCIEGNTLIDTPNGKVAAKDLSIGDYVSSFTIEEIPSEGEENSTYFDYINFASPTLNIKDKTTTAIIDIVPSVKNTVLYFNKDDEKLYSTTQPMFIKRFNYFEIIPCASIEIGDKLIKIDENGNAEEVLIESIDFANGDFTVYQFNCEPLDWFIAGEYLVHNKA